MHRRLTVVQGAYEREFVSPKEIRDLLQEADLIVNDFGLSRNVGFMIFEPPLIPRLNPIDHERNKQAGYQRGGQQ